MNYQPELTRKEIIMIKALGKTDALRGVNLEGINLSKLSFYNMGFEKANLLGVN